MLKEIEAYNVRSDFGALFPKVVLFDMDGTLYNSMPNHAVAWIEMFTKNGIHFTAEDSYAAEGARGTDTIRKFFLAQKGLSLTEEEAHTIYAEKARIFATLPTPQIMDGALALMEHISRSNLIIGIVTGSAQYSLLGRIQRDFGQFVSPDHVVTALDVSHGKPSPEPYLIGMEKCGHFRPNETIIVENAPLGIQSGHASGAFTIAVNTGPLSDASLLAAGADILFNSLTALSLVWSELFSSPVPPLRP